MDKFLVSPIKNFENDGGRTLSERNSPKASEEEIVICKENLVEKRIPLTQVLDKGLKIKKIKVKKSRGEKRKFPDKLDPMKKVKRKKKEEKLLGNIPNVKEGTEIDALCIEESLPSELQGKKKNVSPEAKNNCNPENEVAVVNQKSSRKSKAIASTCKNTLDILLKFDLGVLSLLDESLKIIKSHNLLDNKYISVDILMDLITLALGKDGVVGEDSEKGLSFIITKSVSALCTPPKKSKHITPFSPMKKLDPQEEPLSVLPPPDESILNKDEDLDKSAERSEEDLIAKLPDDRQEQTIDKSGKNFCITNYFKKLKKTVEERNKNERFSSFAAKTDMFLAPKVGVELTGERREKFEEAFTAQDCDHLYLAEFSAKPKRNKVLLVNGSQDDRPTDCVGNPEETRLPEFGSSSEDGKNTFEIAKQDAPKRVALLRVDKPKINPFEAVCRNKAKLLQFHDNRRPAYWGTWRRKSEFIRPRRPFGKDKIFNYEIDSDDEWEEEEEPGESLHGSDDEKEPEEDYEVDNEFFVPHGYLSDDENPEKEKVSSKKKLTSFEEQLTLEQKQKMRKMAPIVFGIYWMHKGLPSEGTLYQDLQVERLQYVPWTSVPVEIEEETEEEPKSVTKKSKQKIFPNEEIPNLIKMIHGSPLNSDHLAKKFLLYWETEKTPDGNRPGLTKNCVLKKIKELAAWQGGHEKGKMCWQVPKETRKEFGAEVEKETPEKKPRKCFIWKFVRKAEKSPGANAPPPPPLAPSLEPEVIIIDS